MLISKLFGLIAFQVIVISIINGDSPCNEINDLFIHKECECLEAEKPKKENIFCRGDEVTKAILDNLLGYYGNYFSLCIQNTNLTEITENQFEKFSFERIFIENNNLLESIDESALDSSSNVSYLVIRNNQKLKGDSIFGLARALAPKVRIEFEGNAISSIPIGAFGKNENLKYIFMQNNKIESIDVKAFSELSNLSQLVLQYNELDEIYGLNFKPSPDGKERNISVFLNNNKLSEKSIKVDFEKQDKVNVKLFLEDNLFKKVPEKFKKFLTGSKNEIYFHNNEFDCDKSMKWVQDYPKQVFNVWCSNLDESLFRVNL